MSNANENFTICVPKTWEFVHSTVCKYFADNQINFEYHKLISKKESDPIALYLVNDQTIHVYKETVLYDNEYDIILNINCTGQMCKDLKDALLNIPANTIAYPFDDCSFI